MTKADKQQLLTQAAKLYKLGLEVEAARKNLKKLVERGVPYDDPKMLHAYEYFTQVDNEWKQLEIDHLRLREKLGIHPDCRQP